MVLKLYTMFQTQDPENHTLLKLAWDQARQLGEKGEKQ